MLIPFDFLNNENVDNFVLILNFKYLFFDKKKKPMVLSKCCLKEKCVMIILYGKRKQTYDVESSKRLRHGKRNVGGTGELSLILAPQGIHP